MVRPSWSECPSSVLRGKANARIAMSAVNFGIPTAYSLLEQQEEYGRQVERQLKYRHVQLFMSSLEN